MPTNNVYYSERALDPWGPLSDDEPERDRPSCNWSRSSGDYEKPSCVDHPVRYRQRRIDTGPERAKQGAKDRLARRVLGGCELVRGQSALQQPQRTVAGSGWIKRDPPKTTTLREVIKLEAGV